MDSIHTCIALMKHNCFMASLDLQDAFYSIPIDRKAMKFVKFEFSDKLFRFTALPMGYARSPLIFTKLMKPVFSQLRKQGHVSSSFLDDSFLEGDTYDACKQNVVDTMTLMAKLGLTLHLEKSVIEPTQTIEHLGFTLNSMNMTVSLTEEKFSKIREKCLNVKSEKSHYKRGGKPHRLYDFISPSGITRHPITNHKTLTVWSHSLLYKVLHSR